MLATQMVDHGPTLLEFAERSCVYPQVESLRMLCEGIEGALLPIDHFFDLGTTQRTYARTEFIE